MYLTKDDLEQKADEVNAKYFPLRLEKAMALDPYDLIDKIGAQVEWKYISPDESILGMSFFGDGIWYIWDKGTFNENDRPTKEFFPKDTILINQVVLDKKNNRKTENFIVAHEVSHLIKDRAYFEKHPDSEYHICKKNDFEHTYWYKGMDELEIIERQTNFFGAAILMPKEIIKKEFFRLLRYKNIPTNPIPFQTYMKTAIGQLSTTFQVNFNPVIYRLYDIGVLERP